MYHGMYNQQIEEVVERIHVNVLKVVVNIDPTQTDVEEIFKSSNIIT